jgi:DNA-binding MarR family transcriptional regulator
MHAIAFGTKRAFHGFLRVTRKALASFELTAARFDLLSAVGGDCLGPADSPMAQSDLRRILGVSAPVVSRMLKALEALGFVDRYVIDEDRRHRFVVLTAKGVAVIREARRMLLRPMRCVVADAVCSVRVGRLDRREQAFHVDALETYLGRLRHSFRDHALLYYPWRRYEDAS